MATRFEQRQAELERQKNAQQNVSSTNYLFGLTNSPMSLLDLGSASNQSIDSEIIGTPQTTNNAVSISDEDIIGGQVDTTPVATQPPTTQQPTTNTTARPKAPIEIMSEYLRTLPQDQRLDAAAKYYQSYADDARREADRASYEREAAKMREESELKRLMKLAKSPGFRELTEAGLISGQAKLPGVTTVDEQKNLLKGLEPTQLTYLLGELGYDITPKAPPTPTRTTTTPSVDTEALETSPTGIITNPSVAEYAALPVGAKYIYNGVEYTKGEENAS